MDKLVNNIKEKVNQVDEMVKESDAAVTEMRVQFAMMVEMQREEREALQKSHEREVTHWKHVCIGLILTICLMVGSIVGGLIYFFSNYEIAFGYEQSLYMGGDGSQNIYDGIHYDRTD